VNAGRRSATVAAGALLVGSVVGGGLVAQVSPSPHAPATSDKAAGAIDESIQRPTERPKDRSIIASGPWQAGQAAPDLIPAQTDDGQPGFLLTFDVAHADAENQMTRRVNEKTVAILLPVYAEDGVTQIGEFTAGTISEN